MFSNLLSKDKQKNKKAKWTAIKLKQQGGLISILKLF